MIVSSFFHPGLFARGFHFKSASLQTAIRCSGLLLANHHHGDRDGRREDELPKEQLDHIISPSSSSCRMPAFFSSWMLRPSPRISLHNTSKLTGFPASSVFVPFTMDS